MEKKLEVKLLYNSDLWEMAKVIIQALKNAKKMPDGKDVNWSELEGEWFDWLKEELTNENE